MSLLLPHSLEISVDMNSLQKKDTIAVLSFAFFYYYYFLNYDDDDDDDASQYRHTEVSEANI